MGLSAGARRVERARGPTAAARHVAARRGAARSNQRVLFGWADESLGVGAGPAAPRRGREDLRHDVHRDAAGARRRPDLEDPRAPAAETEAVRRSGLRLRQPLRLVVGGAQRDDRRGVPGLARDDAAARLRNEARSVLRDRRAPPRGGGGRHPHRDAIHSRRGAAAHRAAARRAPTRSAQSRDSVAGRRRRRRVATDRSPGPESRRGDAREEGGGRARDGRADCDQTGALPVAARTADRSQADGRLGPERTAHGEPVAAGQERAARRQRHSRHGDRLQSRSAVRQRLAVLVRRVDVPAQPSSTT